MKFVLVTKRRTPQSATWEYRPVLRGPRYLSRKKDPVVCVLWRVCWYEMEMFERFSIERWLYSYFLWFGITILKDWLQKLAPPIIQSEIKDETSRDSLTLVFPRFLSTTCTSFGFSLSVIGQSVSEFVLTHSVDYLTWNDVHLNPSSFFHMVLFSSVCWEYFKPVKARLQLWLC